MFSVYSLGDSKKLSLVMSTTLSLKQQSVIEILVLEGCLLIKIHGCKKVMKNCEHEKSASAD